MKIAIASGKGGTGKTLVATNLALVASRHSEAALYDLDVEEPNCHLFLDTGTRSSHPVETMIPVIDETRCTHCGACADICEFNALVVIPHEVLVFPDLCHACHGCLELCPEGAVEEGSKIIGNIVSSRSGSLHLVSGELAIGEPAAATLIGKTKQWPVDNGGIRFYDAPPGTSCPVIESVKGMDYVVLVGEPTRFGLHDLDLMARTLDKMHLPFGVVANKVMEADRAIEEYCAKRGIEVLGRIPWRRDIAAESSHGRLVAETLPDLRELFEALLDRLPASSMGVDA